MALLAGAAHVDQMIFLAWKSCYLDYIDESKGITDEE